MWIVTDLTVLDGYNKKKGGSCGVIWADRLTFVKAVDSEIGFNRVVEYTVVNHVAVIRCVTFLIRKNHSLPKNRHALPCCLNSIDS